MAKGTTTCKAMLNHRDVFTGFYADCNAPAKTERGYCLRHDPATKPQRDAQGRIVKRDARYCGGAR